jgi:hypothetical protein
MINDIPTVIRYDASGKRIAIVVTILGRGRLEARFQVYEIGPSGKTHLTTDSVWGSEQGAIQEWEKWEGRA